jgi:hypothetical protein
LAESEFAEPPTPVAAPESAPEQKVDGRAALSPKFSTPLDFSEPARSGVATIVKAWDDFGVAGRLGVVVCILVVLKLLAWTLAAGAHSAVPYDRAMSAFEFQVRAFAATHGERARAHAPRFDIETVRGADTSTAFLSVWEKRLDAAASAVAAATAHTSVPVPQDTDGGAVESPTYADVVDPVTETPAALIEQVEQAKRALMFAKEAANNAEQAVKRIQLMEEVRKFNLL